jgi:hypothetical protein
MPNSIGQESSKPDNAISELVFVWTAIFKDGTYINQFVSEEEHLFKEVQDRFSDLQSFILSNNKTHTKFIVDLERGLICGNGVINNYKIEVSEKKNVRLIHFRRHLREFTEAGKEIRHVITYYLGYQYLDKNEKNCQILLQIDSDGSWILEEK